MTLSEISRRTELPTTTTLRLLKHLTDEGVLVRGNDRRFWIGPQMIELARRFSSAPHLGRDLLSVPTPHRDTHRGTRQ